MEPITPTEAKELYHKSRREEVAERTLELQENYVGKFVDWCNKNDIDNMNDVTARTVHEFRLTFASKYAQSTLSVCLSIVRRFIQFCESIDGIEPGVAERIELPNREENARDEMLESERAEEILAYLGKYHYSSRSHALLSLMWHTGLRVGTVRSLDVNDYDPERDRLRIHHRPDTGTPLKNKENAERYVTLSPEVSEIIRDYIGEHRHDVTDDYDRTPLFTTRNGRARKNTLGRNIYAVTRPCMTEGGCPHGKDPDTCNGAERTNSASQCPSSVSPHPVRRGAITHFLRRDVPEKIVSDRMNVSQNVLDRHYDRRTEGEKAEQRRSFLSNV